MREGASWLRVHDDVLSSVVEIYTVLLLLLLLLLLFVAAAAHPLLRVSHPLFRLFLAASGAMTSTARSLRDIGDDNRLD